MIVDKSISNIQCLLFDKLRPFVRVWLSIWQLSNCIPVSYAGALLSPACETWLVDKQTVCWCAQCQCQAVQACSADVQLFPDFNHTSITRNQSNNLGRMLNQHKSWLRSWTFTALNWLRVQWERVLLKWILTPREILSTLGCLIYNAI